MCQVNVKLLLAIYVAPKSFQFSVLSTVKDGEYGLMIERETEKIFMWEHTPSNHGQVHQLVEDILKLSIKYGELAFFSGKTFISEYCTQNVFFPPRREDVLDEIKMMGILQKMRTRSAKTYEFAQAA